jgi:hypothetical protein
MTRNVANITMDLSGLEEVDLATLGGTDTVTVNNLTGTDLGHVNVDLNGTGGVADTLVDTVVVTGTAGPDVVTVGATNGVLEVEGVGSQVFVTSAEPELDVLDFVVQGADEVHVLGTSGPDNMFVTPSPVPAAVGRSSTASRPRSTSATAASSSSSASAVRTPSPRATASALWERPSRSTAVPVTTSSRAATATT